MKILRFCILIIFVFLILLIPQVLIFQDFFHKAFDSVLNLKIRESYLGGEKLVSFSDKLNDDNGAGSLTYPKSSLYKNSGSGLLDLVTFKVFNPQTAEDWSHSNIYWQFSYRLQKIVKDNSNGLIHPVITHYIGIDGIDMEGKIDTLNSRAELLTFDKPWHYAIEIYGNKAYIFAADGEYKEELKLLITKDSIYVRIPLNNKKLRTVFAKPRTYHYVLCGAYDYYSSGKYLPVKKKATSKTGGGAMSPLTPRVYDIIAPSNHNQKDLLKSYNEESFTYAKLYPVIADLSKIYKDEQKINLPSREELLKQLKQENKLDTGDLKSRHNKLLKDTEGKNDIESVISKGISYFNIGEYAEALNLIEKALELDSKNPVALAYKGSLKAKEAGTTDSVSKSLEYVYEAFNLYEQALSYVDNVEDELEVLLNRAYVAQSVPESVFNMSKRGALDFLRAVEIFKQLGRNERISHFYLMASICYKQAGNLEESNIYLNEALSIGTLSVKDKIKVIDIFD